MLNYAITYCYTDKRDEAFDLLSPNEEKLNFKNRFTSLEGNDFQQDDYLGTVKKGFSPKVGDAVKKVGYGVKKAASTVAKALMRRNPLSIMD